MIGHEGKGSILSHLKNKGWANAVSAGAGNGAVGFEFFKINIDLTKEGLGAYSTAFVLISQQYFSVTDRVLLCFTDHHEDVSAAVFKYFDLLKSSPLQEWAFKEVNMLSEIAFRFKEKSPPTSTAMNLSLQMSRPYPRELLLSAPWLTSNFDEEVMKDAAKCLSVDECRIMIASQTPLEGRTYAEKEQWYGTEYTIEPLSDRLLKVSSSFPITFSFFGRVLSLLLRRLRAEYSFSLIT